MNTVNINIDDLCFSPLNVRNMGSDDEIVNLGDNIRANGLLNPLSVIQNKETNKYEIIAGQRRFLALQQLDYKMVPCNLLDGTKTKEEYHIISLAENMHRLQMKLSERVKTIKKLYNAYQNDMSNLEKLTNINKKTLKQYIKVSALPDEILDRLDAEKSSKISLSFASDLADLQIYDKDKLEQMINTFNEVEAKCKHPLMMAYKTCKYDNVLDFDKYLKKLDNLKMDFHKKRQQQKIVRQQLVEGNNEAHDKAGSDEGLRMEQSSSESGEGWGIEQSSSGSTRAECMEQYIDENKEMCDSKSVRNPELQMSFRDGLIKRFSTCILSDFPILVCEACHIEPYREFADNEADAFDINNGLLLNNIFHTLFDEYLFSIDPKTLKLSISKSAKLYFDFFKIENNRYVEQLEPYDGIRKYLYHHYERHLAKINE